MKTSVALMGTALLLVSNLSHADPAEPCPPPQPQIPKEVNSLTQGVTPIVAHDAVTYATRDSKGNVIATFTQVQGPGNFGTAWKAPDGTLWSMYQGKASNEELDPVNHPPKNGIIQDSPPVNMCKKIGGFLPTADQYKKLATYFDRDNSNPPQFTKTQGQTDWKALFKDAGLWSTFWTSSDDNGEDEPGDVKKGGKAYFGWAFISSQGTVANDADRKANVNTGWAIRCVDRQGS